MADRIDNPEDVSAAIVELTAKPIISSILDRLEAELDSSLAYHAAQHTRDVLGEVVLFSVTEDRPKREIELLAVAAAYHDAGFLVQRNDNEPIAASMVEEAMLDSGHYTEQEIELVKDMILDTKLIYTSEGPQQKASSELSRYLLDADMSNFGRADFFEKLDQVVKERNSVKKQEWAHT